MTQHNSIDHIAATNEVIWIDEPDACKVFGSYGTPDGFVALYSSGCVLVEFIIWKVNVGK